MSLGTIIRRLFPHRAWPYPRGEREIRQVIVVTLGLVFLTLIGIIIGLKYQDEKTLTMGDMYFAAKTITSYSSEAYLIATQSQRQPLAAPYREMYIQNLADNVSTTKDSLATHETAPAAQYTAAKLAAICDQLSAILQQLTRSPSDQDFKAHANKLQSLTDQAKSIEESL